MKRMRWIDGIKGIACIAIFYHHFLLRYMPESYYGVEENNPIVYYYLSETPLGFIINGNFFVFLFIFISGYVIAMRVSHTNQKDIGIFIVNRYIKLAAPLLICESFCYLFYKLEMGGELFTEGDKISLFTVINNSLVRVLCFGDTTFAGAYWMMNYIFIGGLIVTTIAMIGWKDKKYAMFVCGIISIALLVQSSFYFSTIFSGAFIFYYFELRKDKLSEKIYIIMLLGGIFFAAYPTGVIPDQGIYQYFVLLFTDNSAYVWHWLAAILVFVSIHHIECIKIILEVRGIQWLGEISYIFFVFHNFMRKIFDPFYNIVFQYSNSKLLAVIIDSFVVLFTLFLVCEIYKRTFGTMVGKLSNLIIKPLKE